MNKNYILREDETEDAPYRRIYLLVKESGWARASIGAAFGVVGGILSIILGALLWAVIPFLAPSSLTAFLNGLEILFFVIPVPLLALGACCLDKLEKLQPLPPLQHDCRPVAFVPLQRVRPRHPHNN